MKRYVIFAGVNGAGKSTLYQTNESVKSLPRINVDEAVREIGDWRNPKDVYDAARTTVVRLKKSPVLKGSFKFWAWQTGDQRIIAKLNAKNLNN